MFRTDSHNNPTAFTTDVAREAGLTLGVDYEQGDPFTVDNPGGAKPITLHTARILGDAVAVTIRVIDKIGFYTRNGQPRWNYIAIPKVIWDSLDGADGLPGRDAVKSSVIGGMYQREGGTKMLKLFVGFVRCS